jgi:GT2 family glycosyltransferase
LSSSDGTPAFSVVMPMLNAAAFLPRVLDGLKASTFQDFELLLVDDGSTDGSRELAQTYGITPLWSGGRQGAGAARNVGVRQARAPILVFVDADVVLHETALAQIAERFAADATLTAVMGAYDEAPSAPGLVSRFRNLLHAYFHRRAAAEASTFWTGLGAVRREAFNSVGGFSPAEILEDVEFGLRLKAAGHRIALDPRIQGTHLKDWSLESMVRTDLFRRGIPWIELALQRDGLRDDLNTSLAQRVSVAATAVFLLAVAGGVATQGLGFLGPALGVAAALFLPMLSPGDGQRPGARALAGLAGLAGTAALALWMAGDRPAAIAIAVAGGWLAAAPQRFEARSGLLAWATAVVLAVALALSLAALPLSPIVVVAGGAWLVQLGLNIGILATLCRRLGPVGLLSGAPLLMIYHLCCGLSVIVGTARHLARRPASLPA